MFYNYTGLNCTYANKSSFRKLNLNNHLFLNQNNLKQKRGSGKNSTVLIKLK